MADPFGPMSDREILVQIATDVGAMKSAIYGDKRPGLLEQVAAHTNRLDTFDRIYRESQPLVEEAIRMKQTLDGLVTEVPSTKERKAAWGAVATAIGLALAGLITGLSR